jgi:transposase InsO family protein
MVSPRSKRRAVRLVAGLCSQRRACRYLELHRSSSRYREKGPNDWLLALQKQVEHFSKKYPRLGYRKLTRILKNDGWKVGKKLIQRIRRECGLRVRRWLKKFRRRGKSTGVIPTRAERIDHVWCWDFVADRTDNGGKLRLLSIVDEYTRECLVIHVARKITAEDLVSIMDKLIQERGVPGHIRSDNGPEFIAKILQKWLLEKKIKTLYIEPGSPWQNGHIESFNACLRDECIDREIILSLAEARVLAQDYKNHYNQQRPHGGVGYRTPAQANREARQALASSRPTDSFHQELVHSIQPAIISP